MRETRNQPDAPMEASSTWSVLDKALVQLARNRDLVETADHKYIVGFLCQALSEPGLASGDAVGSDEGSRQAALKRVRLAIRRANTDNRDLVQELITERRNEAQHG